MKQFRIFTLMMLSIVFFSCEKDTNDIPVDLSSESAEITAVNLETSVKEIDDTLDDLAIYSTQFLNAFDKSVSGKTYFNSNLLRFGFFRKCADIEIQQANNTFTVTITFNGECEDRSGNAITGVVVLTRSNSDSSLENLITITNLSIDGYVMNGTRSYSFLENNEAGNIEIQASVEITIVTDEGTISKVGERIVEISEGDDIETIEDNVKTITGSLVYSVLGKELKMEITTPLVKPATCNFIVSGVKTYTREEGVSVLDFGDGTCDNLAVLTLADGTQQQIVLGTRGVDLDDNNDSSNDDENDDGNDNDDNDDDNDDNDSEMSCTLTTPCEVVVFENTSNLSVVSNSLDGVLTITVTNPEGEIVYEEECTIGGAVSLDCISSNE